MNLKNFTSPQGWFTLTLPVNWDEYDDDEGTSAFFNTELWSGNLRITPIRWDNVKDSNEDKVAKLIDDEFVKNERAKKVKIGTWDGASYTNEVEQDGEEFLIYYWSTGKNNMFFLCSFTIEKKQENSKRINDELEVVLNILGSIKIS